MADNTRSVTPGKFSDLLWENKLSLSIIITILLLCNFDNMRGNLPLFFIWLVIGIGFGGFLEEITFRGYLITRLTLIIGDSLFSLILILLLTSVSFGLAHLYQDWSGVISTGTFAFIFGVIFIQSKYNLWMPILIHGFANVTGLVLIYTNYDTVLNGLLF